MIKFRYKRKPTGENKDTTNVNPSKEAAAAAATTTPSKAKGMTGQKSQNKIKQETNPPQLIKTTTPNKVYSSAPLSPPNSVTVLDEHEETFNSCVRAVVVSEIILLSITLTRAKNSFDYFMTLNLKKFN